MVIAADPDARPAGRPTPPIREAGYYCSHPVQTHTGQRAANGPRAQPNRGLKMPRRKTTREQDRAKRIDAERARNQELRENPGNDCDDAYFHPDRDPQGTTTRRRFDGSP
jgi:hypothetical protein